MPHIYPKPAYFPSTISIPSNTFILRPTPPTTPNGIHIQSAIFPQFTHRTDSPDRYTYRQTDKPYGHDASRIVVRIAASAAAIIWIPCLSYFGFQREKYGKFRLFPTLKGCHLDIREQIKKADVSRCVCRWRELCPNISNFDQEL